VIKKGVIKKGVKYKGSDKYGVDVLKDMRDGNNREDNI
jgi:hypothetical protein